ncbi:uncharacterized protein ACA1_237820 [Acanthamoeba castellanii str. Neff]|uniref:Uncharacterized protein n=1 Tax=Acanthamoeba castellanii (strain ATCC 30010 / Neff) TaxID=1257118 RepID=L8GKB8_ACACF|nr:uncharacterized protein ACA1_237820 [Acanthamoeba castellanii str. Neff]ELR13289.1 hypothetical protein ACA1_237820 [Acanthamoeba castellanii str. Neff]
MLMMEPEAEGHAGPHGEEYWRERCAALQAEVAEWRSKAEERREEMEEVEASFAEFMESSKALEQEMERDLQRSEKKNDETSRALSLLKLQHEDLLAKHARVTEEYAKQLERQQVARTHTGHTDACDRQAETETLRSELKVIGVKKRQLEQDNDDLGRRERESSASVADLGEKLDKAIEENACLQSELEEARSRTEELIQRLKEEISEQKSELAVRAQQIGKLTLQALDAQEQSEPLGPDHETFHFSGEAAASDFLSRRHKSVSDSLASPSPSSTSPSLPGSSPLHLVNNMLHLVKDLEKRLSSYSSSSSPSPPPQCSPYSSPYASPFRLPSAPSEAPLPHSDGSPLSPYHHHHHNHHHHHRRRRRRRRTSTQTHHHRASATPPKPRDHPRTRPPFFIIII